MIKGDFPKCIYHLGAEAAHGVYVCKHMYTFFISTPREVLVQVL